MTAGANGGCITPLTPASIHVLRSASLLMSASLRSTLITVDGAAAFGSVCAVNLH